MRYAVVLPLILALLLPAAALAQDGENQRVTLTDVQLLRTSEPVLVGHLPSGEQIRARDVVLVRIDFPPGVILSGPGGAPDPIWMLNDLPVRRLSDPGPSAVLMGARPDDLENAFLYVFVPDPTAYRDTDGNGRSIDRIFARQAARALAAAREAGGALPLDRAVNGISEARDINVNELDRLLDTLVEPIRPE